MNTFLRVLILSFASAFLFAGRALAMTDEQKHYACDRIMEALEKEELQENIPTGVKASSPEEFRELKHYFDMLYYGGGRSVHFWAKSLKEEGYELCVDAENHGAEAVLEHQEACGRLTALAQELCASTEEKTLDNIYRYVIEHVKYSEEIQTPLYTAVMEEKTTCAGYAALFERLCSLNRISCAVVWGAEHAYNLVQLDGESRVYDTTFDAAAGYGSYSGRPLAELAAWKAEYYCPRLVEPSDFPVPSLKMEES